MNNFVIKPRGTTDLYGEKALKHEKIKKILFEHAKSYDYSYIQTPIFEEKSVFIKSLGEETELVKKEFFELLSQNDSKQYVLRPENTASTMRLVGNEKLIHKNSLPLKLFYYGQMFRYERPQAGRLREFNQFGVEVIGSNNWNDDLELLIFANSLIKKLNLENHTILKINYLGDINTNLNWNAALKKHFRKYKDQLSDFSVKRIETNPIRILDDKNDADLDCVKNAPKIYDFLNDEQKDYFQKILKNLEALKINYQIDFNLVRGFDYYTGIIFEYDFNEKNNLNKQSTLLGGGRYHKLLENFSYDSESCLGLALGVERLIIALDLVKYDWNLKENKDIYLAILVNEPDIDLWKLLTKLREHNLTIQTNWEVKKIQKHFKIADKSNADFVFIYGVQEQTNKEIKIRSQKDKTEKNYSLENFAKIMKEVKKGF